jgi:hypothetical protein
MAQVGEHLRSNWEALSSNSATAKKSKNLYLLIFLILG